MDDNTHIIDAVARAKHNLMMAQELLLSIDGAILEPSGVRISLQASCNDLFGVLQELDALDEHLTELELAKEHSDPVQPEPGSV